MRKFGLIGFPLGHSFSKKYFTEKFVRENIYDCSYENYPLEHLQNLSKLISEEPDLQGVNITIPYKSEVIKYLDVVSQDAAEVGAVNVIKIKRIAGKYALSGFNSDIDGIRASLKDYFSSGVVNALVLGTGGGSRAVCFVLEKAGIKVRLVSRSRAKNTLSYSEVNSDIIKDSQLIVNTTPVGMFPDVAKKPDIDYDSLTSDHILFDLIYNPEKTLFLRIGEEKGCVAINGLKMLHVQAERAWDIWNDQYL